MDRAAPPGGPGQKSPRIHVDPRGQSSRFSPKNVAPLAPGPAAEITSGSWLVKRVPGVGAAVGEVEGRSETFRFVSV